MDQLEAPADVGALYMARGEEVERFRPVMFGDVFKEIPIPGIEDGLGLGVVLTHPCAMRMKGGALRPTVQMARVVDYQYLPPRKWGDGWFDYWPLLDLRHNGDHLAVDFFKVGTVDSAQLQISKRIAYLSNYGATVLLQRLLHHNSRVVVALSVLHDQAAPNFEEAELLHEWLEALVTDLGSDDQIGDQTREFNEFLDANGQDLRKALMDVVQRSTVRKRLRLELKQRTH